MTMTAKIMKIILFHFMVLLSFVNIMSRLGNFPIGNLRDFPGEMQSSET